VACDLVAVGGGLTTAVELTANKRPFLCFRLRHISSRISTYATDSSATARAAFWTWQVGVDIAAVSDGSPGADRRNVAVSHGFRVAFRCDVLM
jgi:hypothetical protein